MKLFLLAHRVDDGYDGKLQPAGIFTQRKSVMEAILILENSDNSSELFVKTIRGPKVFTYALLCRALKENLRLALFRSSSDLDDFAEDYGAQYLIWTIEKNKLPEASS